jgi:hypothetical protein
LQATGAISMGAQAENPVTNHVLERLSLAAAVEK